MGKLTINGHAAMFNSYVKLPEGKQIVRMEAKNKNWLVGLFLS